MNGNIRKITQGAMFLAMYGAALLINRELSFMFDQIVSLISSLVIVIYISKFSFKDGVILSFCIFIMSFLFGGTYVLVYTPLSILGGLVYGYGIKRKLDRNTLLFILIALYTIGEFVLTLIIMPIFGAGDISEYTVVVQEMLAFYNVTIDAQSLESFTKIVFSISIFFIAVMEALLIHLSSVIIFKKFKLGTIKTKPIDQIKLKPIYAYICMGVILLNLFAFKMIDNEIINYSLLALSLLSEVLLVAQGYIFCLVYGIIVLRKNISLLLVLTIFLLMPYSLLILLIFGFLYATGPLYRYLNRKRGI